jgi:hypothetical protein
VPEQWKSLANRVVDARNKGKSHNCYRWPSCPGGADNHCAGYCRSLAVTWLAGALPEVFTRALARVDRGLWEVAAAAGRAGGWRVAWKRRYYSRRFRCLVFTRPISDARYSVACFWL